MILWILRDTCASKSLVLKDMLPLCDESPVGTGAVLQGVGLISVPLHVVELKSD